MTHRAASFIVGFTCGALVFIALQSFGQSDVRCAETGWDCQGIELPALGALPAGERRAEARKQDEKKNPLVPIALTVGMVGVMTLYGQGSDMPCATYPCAHYAHVGTGAILGYVYTAYYGPGWALGLGLAMGVGKELLDKHDGKSFNRTDVVTRLLGTGVGIYLAKTF